VLIVVVVNVVACMVQYTTEVVEMMKDPDKMEEAVNYLESLMTDEEKAVSVSSS
jgi:hypothetical protein